MTTTASATPAPAPGSLPNGSAARSLVGRAVRGGVLLMAARLLMQGFVWAVTLTVARLLTPFDYGLMTAGMVFINLADLLAEAGVGRALVQKEDLESTDVAAAFTFSMGLSGVLYGGLFLAAGVIGMLLDMPPLGMFLRVLGLLVLLIPFRTVSLALLDRNLHLGRQAVVHVLTSVVQSGTVLAMALAGMGAWALAVGALVGRFLEILTLVVAARWRPKLAWPGRSQHALMWFGVNVSLGSLLWYIYSNCDFAIVGAVSGPVELGYYALAFQLISMPVQKLTGNTNQLVYPVFCRLQNDRPRLRDWYLRLTVLLGFFGMPTLAGMALVAPDAFPLVLGKRWNDAIVPFQLLAVVGILMVYSHSLPPLFNALGRPDLNLRYTIACVVLFPLAFWIGIEAGGLTGICLAWVLLYPVMVGSLLYLTRHVTGVRPWDFLRAQAPLVGAVLVMVGIVLTIQLVLAETAWPWLRLGLSIVAGAAAYAGVLLAFARRSVLADLRALLRELRGGGAATS